MSASRRRTFGILMALVATGGLAAYAVAQPAARPPVAGNPGAIEASLQTIFAKSGVRAAAWCLVKDGKVISQQGFGFADANNTHPVHSESTVFRAASNGKLFVALAALLVAAAGQLDLHADVNSILIRVRLPATFTPPVTLHHLLTHTGGFEGRFLGGLASSPAAVVPLGEYLEKRMPARVFSPGQWLSYSNHGMALAGLVIQDAAGKRFDDLATATIFQPLGMNHTTFRQPAPDPIRDALIRDPRGDGPWLNPYPAGSMVTTAADMGRFLLALLGATGRDGTPLISSRIRESLLAQHYTANAGMPGVAYGFFEGVANGHRTLHHTGDGGDHSLVWLDPDANAGFFVVYTTPAAGNSAEPRELAARAVGDWLFPAASFVRPPPPADFADRAARFAGIYRPTQLAVTTLEKLAALPAQIRVTARGDRTLGVALGLGAESELFVETSPLLFRSAGGAYVAFSQDRTGRITGLTGTGGTVDDPLSAARVRWIDDSRLHLGVLGAALVVVLARLLVMAGALASSIARLVGRGLLSGATRTLAPDGWGWRVSGMFAVLCAAAPAVSAVSIIRVGGPMFQVPNGVYVGLSLLALASLTGVLLVPLAAQAWARREGPGWHRVLMTAVVLVGVGAAPFLSYWNLLGFKT